MNTVMKFAVLCVAAVAMSGCTNVGGKWTGTIESSTAGTGTLQVNLVQNFLSLSGTWTSDFSGVSRDNGGTVNGRIFGSNVTLTLIPGSLANSCPFAATASASSDGFSGTYSAFDCPITEAGSFALVKE